MSYSVFEEKYLPKAWGDLLFADPDIEAELREYMLGNLQRNLLLYGAPGTGKSVTAALIAKGQDRVGDHFTWHEDQTNLWPQIDTFLKLGGSGAELFDNSRFAIFEEVDHLKGKQTRLRSRMSQHKGVLFILTTNHLSKVEPQIRDRSHPVFMERPSPEQWLPRAKNIMDSEGVNVSDEALLKFLIDSNGSMRDIIRALELLVLELKKQ